MDPTLLLNRPVAKPRIVAKITKFNNLVEVSTKARKSSAKLRKVFEKGSYQKKTQLSVLNRYKKRLETIQKQNDRSFRKKQRVKVKLPDIKKYVGNFFTPGSADDPLKAIAALAAFKSVQKGSKGDWGGALGSGLVAAGLTFGPSLLGRGASALMNRGGGGGGAASPTTTSGGARFFGTPYSQTRAGQAYAGMQAQRNLPGWAQRAAGGSASRFAASNERLIQGTANIGDRARVATGGRFGIGNITERMATRGGGVAAQATASRAGGTVAAKAAGVGARAIPLLGAAVNIGLSAYRFSQGDVVGGILSAVSAIPIVGWAALGIDLAREFGAFDGTFLGGRGQDKLKQQTEKQKRAVEGKREEGGALTFRKTLNSYEKAVNKFEEFSKGFVGGIKSDGFVENIPLRSPTPITDPYTGPISGETFIPLPGATSIGDPAQGQNYGAGRGGRTHQGIDLTERKLADSRAPIVAYKTGKVIKVESGDIYPGGGIEIDHGGGLITRYLHVTPSVNVGDTIYGGQQIGNLFRYFGRGGEQTHLHFEVYQNNQLMNPTSYVTKAKNNIPSPLDPIRAKQHHEAALKISPRSFSQPQPQQPPTQVSGIVPLNLGQMMRQFTFGMPSQPRPPSITSPPPSPRSVGSFLPYETGSQQQITAFYPVSQPQQQPMPSEDVPMMMTGPSEQQLLNSFYKRVLLNTV